MSEPWGLYVHVPWCRRRCPYCAFYVEADRDVPWDAYVDALLAEYALRRPALPEPASTVFLGGGTPSRMPPAALSRLLAGLSRLDDAEVSAECNPEDCTDDWLQGAMEAGVNRVSLGMQTFQPDFARLLNRNSSVHEAQQTAARVAAAGLRSWSLDLIFALPDQTLADLERDLDAIEASGVPHVALYGLTYEPRTAFTRARDAGRFTEASEDLWRAMYERIVERLRGMGLERYEVSNFARPGHRSQHNQIYWNDQPYLGLGPSAHGFLPDGRRYHNKPDAGAYLRGGDPTELIEAPSPEQAAVDALVSGLRGCEGLDLHRLGQRTGLAPTTSAVERLCQEGLAQLIGERLSLTDAGYPVCDAIASHLADRLEPTAAAGSTALRGYGRTP